MFFLNEDTVERAIQVFQTLVEVEYEALHWGDQSTMMLKKTMTLRLEMKVQRASCKVLENAFAETETEKGRFR